MTTPPPESPIPVVTPTSSETAALFNSLGEQQIRELAQQIIKATSLGFEPASFSKAIVTSVSYNTTPPVVSLNMSGDTTTTISGAYLLNNYSPVVGQTVLVGKQGPNFFILGHIADVNGSAVGGTGSGWIKATLSNGSHGGNSNGDIYYRRILDHGSWKVQWRGGWNVSGTMMIDTNNALAAGYRPTSKRSLVAARQIQTGATAIQFDFHSDGRVELVGGTTTGASAVVSGDVYWTGISDFTSVTGSHQHLESSGFFTGFAGSHDHGFGAGHDHAFYGGSHTHTVSTPTWASLNGLEYFL